MMILLSVTAEACRVIRSSLALLVHFLSHLSPDMAQATNFSLVVTLEYVEVVGSGGRDRTADLGVMNPTL
jgi:hypothetical protein